MKILIIEDSSFQRALIKDALKSLELEILEASSIEEALPILSSNNILLILLDLLLPQMDGIEFLKNYKDLIKGAQVIVMTADIQESTQKECYELGAKIFINKPFKKEELIINIKNLLNI